MKAINVKSNIFVVRLDNGEDAVREMIDWLCDKNIQHGVYCYVDPQLIIDRHVEAIILIDDDIRAVEFKLRWC